MILSLDAGTTSIRGVLYTDKGVGDYISRYDTSPRFPDEIRVEQDPEVWQEALQKILSDCGAYLKEKSLPLEGICLTTFRSPVFPADKEGRPLMPALMWQDRRTDGLCRELQEHSSFIYRTTGLPLTSVFSAVKMLWIARQEPEVLGKTHHMAGIYDYLMFLMTGKFLTDESVASRFNLYDLSRKEWNPQLLDLFSVNREHLPEVIPPGGRAGGLSAELASRTGLPSGTPVICGGGDQQCAALGLGVISPGQVAVNTGTGAYVIGLADQPLTDPEEALFVNASAIPGRYILEANMLTAGTIYRWFSETFLDPERPAAERFSIIDKEIARSPAGSNGVILLPHFKGSGKDSSMKGAFLNLDLNTTRGDMARAVLEGIALELSEQLERYTRLAGGIDGIAVSGGMTRFDLYNQIQADLYRRPVTSWGGGEATALGAWMNGMMGLGKATDYRELWNSIGHEERKETLPLQANRTVYDRLKKRKRQFLSP